jgi:hypothetical protein
MKRALLGVLVLLAVAVVGVVEGAWAVVKMECEQRGATWTGSSWSPLSRSLSGFSYGPFTDAELSWSPTSFTTARLSGARVELLDRPKGASGGGSSEEGGSGGPPLLVVEDLQVLAAGEPLATLSGEIVAGVGELRGEGASLTLPGPQGARARLILSGLEVPHEAVSGPVELSLLLADPPRAELSAAGLRVKHELLSERSMGLPPLTASLELVGNTASGPVQLGEVTGTLRLDLDTDRLELSLPDQPAEPVFRVFEDIVPELKWAHVDGTVGAEASYGWSDGSWTLEPRLRDLQVDGAVRNLGELRGGRFTYRAWDADGEEVFRDSGEGTPGWVPWHQVSPHLFAAVVAAEDSAFHSHAGYSEASILAAIEANQEAGGVVRGGSTITQQLAKNLYLDGERSLERKLRELLLAIELDRALGKRRVLEIYVNIVEWGPGFWGVQAASETYFLRQPQSLPPNEAAFLAALLPDPKGTYTRWYLRDRASSVRIDWILENMANGGDLSPAEARAQAAAPLRFVPPPK